jgi:hypothetical protein
MPIRKVKKAEIAAKEQARQERLAAQSQQFEAALEAANGINDPIEKILKLAQVERQIHAASSDENRHIENEAERLGQKRLASGIGGGALFCGGGLVAIFTVASGGLALPIIGAATIAGELGAPITGAVMHEKKKKAVVKEMTEKSNGYFSSLQELKERSVEMRLAVVEEKAEEIAQSPDREKIMGIPGIQAKFSEVVADRLTQYKQTAEAEKAEAAAKAKTAKAPKKPSSGADYSGITGALRPKNG